MKLATLLILTIPWLPTVASAQSTARASATPPELAHALQRERPKRAADDSLRALRAARDAQSAFELRRRRLLPVVPSGSGGRCDVRLGRFCYWHDDDDSDPPDEPQTIAKAREEFTAQLDSLARRSPGDAWIAGQRVRYLVESRAATRAVEAASECEAESWWCRALEGFALHALGDGSGADSAFDAALASMPNDQRCRWEDIRAMLPDRAAARYRAMSCEGRRAFSDTLWWLAQPLWSMAGNDRRTEHYARHVMSRLERESKSTYEMGWGEDTHELLIRYGWPTSWSRDVGSFYDMTAVNVVGYEPHPAFDFIPDDSALAAPWAADVDRWKLHNRDALSRYAPKGARRFVRVDVQMSRFARGDSVLVVATTDFRGDTVLQGEDVRGALAVTVGPGQAPSVVSATVSHGRSMARLLMPNGAVLASMELRDSVRREAARARRALAPLTSADARGTILSDLLLFSDPTPHDATLDDVAPRALGRLTIAARSRVGAYWELVRTTPQSDSVTYTLTVTPRDISWLRRMTARVGIGDRPEPVHIRFTEPIGKAHVASRVLAFDLSRLGPGHYDVRLSVTLPRGEHAEAERSISIAR